ncbi:MAG: energy transducer TonB [Gammaproteobacteria bacterium]|nr:energy transducer TonB [Gammaproteobacteria bacterium]
MSAVVFEGYRPGRLDGWSTSLVLHGALGGLILFAIMGAEKPSLPESFRWDVAFLSAAPAQTPVAQVKPAEPLVAQAQPPAPPPVPRPSRVVTPDPVVARQAVPEAPAVTEAVAPVQQQAAVSAAPVPVIAQAQPSEPEASPPSAVVDTGWLADLLWRRMEALKRYPYLARRNGWEGQVLIKAIIGADGRLLHAEIQQSSGHEALDQDALKVLRASTPLELEQNPSWQQAMLTIPVAYRLQR